MRLLTVHNFSAFCLHQFNQAANLPSVGKHVPIKYKSNEGGVFHLVLDGLVTEGAGALGEEQKGKEERSLEVDSM